MIIGITGTNGAGKGTVVDYLVKNKGFTHYSARDFIVEEIVRRGMPVDRTSTNIVGNDLRKAHGPGYIVEQLLARAHAAGKDAVIESVRAIGEAEFLKIHGALLWAVDANRKVRYERNVSRKSDLDHVSFEQFCKIEDLEFSNPDPAKHNVKKVIDMADHVFTNDGTPQELFLQVEEVLKETGAK